MAQTGDFFNFGSGGGGLIGQNQDVQLNNWRFKVHAFQELAADRKTVIKTYGRQCVMAIDIVVEGEEVAEDKRNATQYYPLGDVPPEFGGEQHPFLPAGGFMPSLDGENAAEEGPFFVAFNRDSIYDQNNYPIFFTEWEKTGTFGQDEKAKIYQSGLAVMNGLRAHLVGFIKRVTEKQKLKKPDATDKTVLVIGSVNQWPWDSAPVATVAQPAAQATAGPKAVKKEKAAAATPAAATPAAPVAAPVPAAVATPTAADAQAKTVTIVKALLETASAPIRVTDIGAFIFPEAQKHGADMVEIMKTGGDPAFLQQFAGFGLWKFDAATNTVSKAG